MILMGIVELPFSIKPVPGGMYQDDIFCEDLNGIVKIRSILERD
jgi:hypothetical protein